MASTNQSPFYQRAEREFLEAKTTEEKIECLGIMIKECPKHKSSENMLRNLKNRLRKLKESAEKQKKSGKTKKQGIKKEDMQCVLLGFPNSGKSSIFNSLTGLHSKVSECEYSTKEPHLGNFIYQNTSVQIIDDAPFPNNEKSLTNSCDVILLVITNVEEIKKAESFLWKANAKILIIFNKEDILTYTEERKIESTLNSKYKKFNHIFFSTPCLDSKKNELKKKIFELFPIIRVYTKEPSKEPSKEPMILKENSNITDAAEKIRKGMSKIIKQIRIWGPSSKFNGQLVGLNHKLKDNDIIEFKTQ